jgi:hypothetical protein
VIASAGFIGPVAVMEEIEATTVPEPAESAPRFWAFQDLTIKP